VIEVGPQVPLDAKVRVNDFEASALTVIPGVGEKLAAAIVEERARAGRFKDLGDMAARVKGFRVSRVGEFEKYLDFGASVEGAQSPKGPR
jgi:DNA uptake protein ComE-like DNA-binding protein